MVLFLSTFFDLLQDRILSHFIASKFYFNLKSRIFERQKSIQKVIKRPLETRSEKETKKKPVLVSEREAHLFFVKLQLKPTRQQTILNFGN